MAKIYCVEVSGKAYQITTEYVPVIRVQSNDKMTATFTLALPPDRSRAEMRWLTGLL